VLNKSIELSRCHSSQTEVALRDSEAGDYSKKGFVEVLVLPPSKPILNNLSKSLEPIDDK
jgi:hypothetical protein